MATTPTHLLVHTITTRRKTVTAGAMGGASNSWADSLQNIKARIQPLSASESVRYGRESTRRMYQIYIAPGQDVTEEDQIQFSESVFTGTATTRTLDIIQIMPLQLDTVVMHIIAEETD